VRGTTISAISLLAGGFVFVPGIFGDCTCRSPEMGDSTRWGGNEAIVTVEERSYRQLRGKIELPDGRPLQNTLVEIFDKPEYLLSSVANSENHPEQKRLAVCRTGSDGRFCFRNLRSGIYELRSSLDKDWDVTHLHVSVNKQAGQNKIIVVRMSAGT
jgi:hypothetical protein